MKPEYKIVHISLNHHFYSQISQYIFFKEMLPYLGFKTLFTSVFVDSDIIDKRNRKTQDMRLREGFYYGKSDSTLMNDAVE